MGRASGNGNEERERSELEAVLASTLFSRAPDLSKIIKYVCEKHLENRDDAIKEYNIALEALGRGPDFRPEVDSIVRVQAARLRKHLKKYYETDGAHHPVQIRISASGYRPEFVHVTPAQEQSASPVETGTAGGNSAGNGESIHAEAPPALRLADPAPCSLSHPGSGFIGRWHWRRRSSRWPQRPRPTARMQPSRLRRSSSRFPARRRD